MKLSRARVLRADDPEAAGARKLSEAARSVPVRILRREVDGLAERAQGEAEARLAAGFVRLAEGRRASLASRRGDVIELGCLLAERILGAELILAPERIEELARQVLASSAGARRLRLWAHPEDLPALRATLSRREAAGDGVELVADPALARGDLVLDADAGTVDGRLRCQLERLGAALAEDTLS